MTCRPPREGNKPHLQEQQWTSLVSLLLFVTIVASGQRYQQHAKLNQRIPEQNCQAGNLLSYQDAPVRICFWIQIQISPLQFKLQPHRSNRAAMKNKYLSVQTHIIQYSAQERTLSSHFFFFSLQHEEHGEW